ncbi:MAG: toxin-antitoxin system HicB family antitoxin [Thermotogota bacterium]
MKKDLNYYMGLGYKIEIVSIPESEGGGFFARLPQFGELGVIGDGDTMEKALENLEEYKRETFERYLSQGKKIPEPQSDSSDKYSGKFLLRLPVYVHRKLAEAAKENKVSLNSYVNNLIAGALAREEVKKQYKEFHKDLISSQCNFSSRNFQRADLPSSEEVDEYKGMYMSLEETKKNLSSYGMAA